MNRPSDGSSSRIIPVQIWELLHTLKTFFSEIKNLKQFFFFFFSSNFYNFGDFLKTLLLNLTMKKRPKNPEENAQA